MKTYLVIEESIDERWNPDEAEDGFVATSQLLTSLNLRVAPDYDAYNYKDNYKDNDKDKDTDKDKNKGFVATSQLLTSLNLRVAPRLTEIKSWCQENFDLIITICWQNCSTFQTSSARHQDITLKCKFM